MFITRCFADTQAASLSDAAWRHGL
jgi:hypothetical protein